MDVDVVAETLAQHRIALSETAPAWVCLCGAGGMSAYGVRRAEAEHHIAERVVEAIRTGAPEAPGADPASDIEAPAHSVPTAVAGDR